MGSPTRGEGGARGDAEQILQDPIQISENVVVGNSNDTVALCSQPPIAHLVSRGSYSREVLAAIDFDNDAPRVTCKVDNVTA